MEQIMRHRQTTPRGQVHPGRLVAAALAVGGLSASFFAAGAASASTNHAAKSVVVSASKNSKLGTILVSGKTLYTLKASKTACTSSCTKIWPELVLPKGVTKATAGTGVKASLLGTVTRAGGVRQVTYNGQPLYWFALDKSDGQVTGNNVTDTWGLWKVYVTVKPKSGSGSTPTTTPSGGGTAF